MVQLLGVCGAGNADCHELGVTGWRHHAAFVSSCALGTIPDYKLRPAAVGHFLQSP